MSQSKLAWVLAVVLVLNLVLAVLLTPLGFESRPTAALQPPGYLAIATVFAGLALDAAALILIFAHRVALAARLAIAGSIFFLFPNIVDQTGIFFSVPIPPIVRTLEYVFIVVLLATIVLAWTMRWSDSMRFRGELNGHTEPTSGPRSEGESSIVSLGDALDDC